MRLSKDAWILIVLLVGVILIVVVFGRQEAGRPPAGPIPLRTTFSPSPDGTKALYLTLTELGYNTQRLRSMWESLPEDGILFMISPLIPVQNSTWVRLRRWVEGGGVLCIFLDEFSPLGWELRVADREPGALKEADSAPCQPSFLASGVRIFRTRTGLRLRTSPVAKKPAARESPWTCVPPPSEELGRMLEGAVPLFKDSRGVTVSYSQRGRGAVLAFCSGWSVSNEAIAKADNLRVILNAVDGFQASGERPVLFDEYHHGFGKRRSVFSLMSLPTKLGLAQACLAVVLFFLAVGRRFGAPVPLPEVRRQREEYMSSMASLLSRAKATDLALRTLRERFVGELRQAVGLGPDADHEETARLVEERKGVAAGEVLSILEACLEAESRGRPSEAKVLSLATRMHQVLEKLRRAR